MAATIFVVDEHDGVRTALRHWLEVEFPLYHVIELISAEEALMRVCFQAPDLVIMDIGFPQQNGIAAVRQLNALIPEVPIVILTILDDNDHRAEAMQAGAAAFISTRKMHEELIPRLMMLLSRVLA